MARQRLAVCFDLLDVGDHFTTNLALPQLPHVESLALRAVVLRFMRFAELNRAVFTAGIRESFDGLGVSSREGLTEARRVEPWIRTEKEGLSEERLRLANSDQTLKGLS